MKINFPSPKELLIRKRVQNEATKVAIVAKAAKVARGLVPSPLLIIESSPKPSTVPEQPPSKKQKVGEKQVKKAGGKRKRKKDKEITPKQNSELRAAEEEEVDI